MAWRLLLCSNQTSRHLHPSSSLPSQILLRGRFRGTPAAWRSRCWPTTSGRSSGFLLGRRLPFKGPASCTAKKGNNVSPAEVWPSRRVLQAALWAAEAVYILWLFLLPYAPVHILFFLPKSVVTRCFLLFVATYRDLLISCNPEQQSICSSL